MILEEKLKAIAAADSGFVSLFSGRIFPGQLPDKPGLPCVVMHSMERPIMVHDAALHPTRPWKVEMFIYAASYILGKIAARNVQVAFCDKRDSDIQSITLEEGIQYLGFLTETKAFAFSVCFDVWENLA